MTRNGSLAENILDQAVERILNIVFEYTDHREEQEFTLEADHELAKKIAVESMVLLKNDSVLPLKETEKLAFIGEFAKKPRFQGGGSSHINSFRVSSALEHICAKRPTRWSSLQVFLTVLSLKVTTVLT